MRTLWWRRRDCWAFWGWTEHSERSVLPTGLSLMEVPPQDKDLLGRWKPEGSDTYARTFAGRVARLQALFAKMARGADRYDRLDEREIAVPWLMERAKLSREQAELTVSGLRRRWKEGDLAVPDSVSDIPAEGPPLDDPAAGAGDADSSQASATEPEEPVCKQAKVLDREARYVIVESYRVRFLGSTKPARVVVGWVGKGPSATAGITPLGRRPMNTRTCVSYAGRLGRGTPRTMIRLRAR